MQGDIRHDLPWMANGTLSGEARTSAEAAVDANADIKAALDWELAMRDAVKHETAEWIAPPAALDKVMARIGRPAVKVQEAAAPNFFARIAEAFRFTPRFAMACAVVVVQFGVIGYLVASRDSAVSFSETRSTQHFNHSTKFIRVMFAAKSTEGDLRELLRNVNAEIVAGPSQLGDYYLLVDQAQLSKALDSLKSNKKIESAEIVNALPSKL